MSRMDEDWLEGAADMGRLYSEICRALYEATAQAGAENAALFHLEYWMSRCLLIKMDYEGSVMRPAAKRKSCERGPVNWIVSGAFDMEDGDTVPFVLVPTHADIGRQWECLTGWALSQTEVIPSAVD